MGGGELPNNWQPILIRIFQIPKFLPICIEVRKLPNDRIAGNPQTYHLLHHQFYQPTELTGLIAEWDAAGGAERELC